jgi:hypothetical protein
MPSPVPWAIQHTIVKVYGNSIPISTPYYDSRRCLRSIPGKTETQYMCHSELVDTLVQKSLRRVGLSSSSRPDQPASPRKYRALDVHALEEEDSLVVRRHRLEGKGRDRQETGLEALGYNIPSGGQVDNMAAAPAEVGSSLVLVVAEAGNSLAFVAEEAGSCLANLLGMARDRHTQA